MALPNNHPVNEVTVYSHSPSIGASPISAVSYAPFRGRIMRMGVVAADLITSADATITVALYQPSAPTTSVAVTSTIVLPVASAGIGQVASAVPTANHHVLEGTAIQFLSAGASGTNIPGEFFATIRPE